MISVSKGVLKAKMLAYFRHIENERGLALIIIDRYYVSYPIALNALQMSLKIIKKSFTMKISPPLLVMNGRLSRCTYC